MRPQPLATTLLALLLAFLGALMSRAEAYTVTLRAEPYTDVLVFNFGEGPTPPFSVRRTGAQQLTVTFHEAPGSPLAAAPKLGDGSLVMAMRPTATGFRIETKTKAFGFVNAPVPGKAEFEVHVFKDVVGKLWVDLTPKQLSLAPAKKPAPATARPTQAAKAPVAVATAAQTPEQPEDLPTHQPGPPAEQMEQALPTLPTLAAPAPRPQEARAESGPAPQLQPSSETLDLTQLTSIGLKEAMEVALKNNPRVSSYESRAAGAALNVKSALGTLLPHAQLNAGLTKIKNPDNTNENNSDYINQVSRNYSLHVSQNLFDGLMRLSNYARVKLVSKRTEQEERRVRLDTAEAVQREYFRLIRIRSDIRTFAASIERLSTQKEAAQAFYRLEMAPRLTVLQVETALAQAVQRLSRAKSDEQVQLTKLNALLGQSAPPKYDFAGELGQYPQVLALDFDDCVRQAQNQLPEVVIARTDLQIAQEELNVTEGKAYPRVDANVTYNKQNTSYSNGTPTADRQYYTAGLNLAWEVFSGGEQYYEAQARKKMLQAAQADLSSILLTVYSVVRESYLNVSEARNQIRIAHLRTKEAAEAYEQASTRFRSGIGTSLDVLDAQEKEVSAEAALNQARADFFISLSSLYRSMGQGGMPLPADPTPVPSSLPPSQPLQGVLQN